MTHLGLARLRQLIVAACIVLLVYCPEPFAQDNSSPSEWIVQNAPESYVVKNGDTLWDIACMFLHDPWRWQQVWCANPEIENPDLIYPGDKLYLSYLDGKPQINVERGASWQTVDKRTGLVKLHPRARSYPAQNPVPTISLNVIGPFLNKSRVVNDNQAKCSPVIVALDEDHIVVGTGDRIFVEGLSPRIPDTVFAVFRPGKEYIDPKTKCCLGIEGIMLGKAEREVVGDPSRLVLTQSLSEIKVGDRLIGTLEQEIDPYFTPKAPDGPADGQIISVFDGITQIGQFQIIVVTGGDDKSRQIGDVLGIYQTQKDIPSRFLFEPDKKYNFPPMKVGSCMVFRVFDKVSYALVMGAMRTIYLLDDVGSP